MRHDLELESVRQAESSPDLDLVVPFTSPELTQAALKAAEQYGTGLKAAVRLLRIQVIPFPLDPRMSPVSPAFLRAQVAKFQSDLPLRSSVIFGRDFRTELCARLRHESIVVLASERRWWWRTNSEKLAARLRKSGHTVLLVYVDKLNA